MVTGSDVLLEISDVTKSFGGLEVLKGVSFEIPRGSITGLIGPNGCGKSTLFDVITGYQRADGGSISFAGASIGGVAPHVLSRRGLIRTFQLTRVFPQLTVAENLLVFTGPQTTNRRGNSEERVLELLDFVHLLGLAEREASTLSYGQLKLLEFAQVLMHKPKLLMLDEPFAGINPGLIEQMVHHLRTLRDEGMTILLVEHNLPVVSQLCDSIAVISGGIVAVNGSPEEVVADPRVKEVFLGD